jgi:hypothetical protein
LRQNRSVIECHLKPLIGHLAVNKLTTLDIDDVYRHLLRAGGAGAARCRRAPCIESTSSCTGR